MLVDLLSECYDMDLGEAWEHERTATPVRILAVRLHATDCSLRESKEIRQLFDVERSHQAIFSGHTACLIVLVTRLRRSRNGSPLTKPLSRLVARGLGYTLQLIPTEVNFRRSVVWIPWHRSSGYVSSSVHAKTRPLQSCVLVDQFDHRTALF